MPRLRRYLPPLLMLLPVIFICGKLLLTQVDMYSIGWLRTTCERGWPWVFELDRNPYRLGNLPDIEFSVWILLADVAVLAIAVGLLSLLLLWQWRRSGGLRRFSLRGLLLLVAVFAVVCGWWTSHFRQRTKEQAFQQDRFTSGTESFTSYCGPAWVRRITPEWFQSAFVHLTLARINADATQPGECQIPRSLIALLPDLTELQEVHLVSCSNTNATINRLRLSADDIKSLRLAEIVVMMRNVTADDQTLRELSQLPRLKALSIGDAAITDDGVAALEKCQRLETLCLADCPEITDGCVTNLRKIPGLKMLVLRFCNQLTENGLARLTELPHLERLDLQLIIEPSKETLNRLHRRIPTIRTFGRLFEPDDPREFTP